MIFRLCEDDLKKLHLFVFQIILYELVADLRRNFICVKKNLWQLTIITANKCS